MTGFEDAETHNDDVAAVLRRDGVDVVSLEQAYENAATTRLETLKDIFGDSSWAVRVVYNERFGGVLIRQNPGEGNRLHYHPDADECWVIMEGTWEWFIDGEGTKQVSPNDIVVVKKGTKHRITCVGDSPGVRFAITAPDVDHVYAK